MSPAEVWIVVSTVLFLCIAARPGIKALTGGLDKRSATIKAELDEAHRLRGEAEALLREARQRHDTARESAEEILSLARTEAARIAAEADSALKVHVARRERQATDRIALAEAEAIAEIRRRAVALAMAASQELLTQALAGEAGDRLLDGAIASLPARLSATAR